MRRYSFLTKEGVYGALNKLRAAFLAAKDGRQVEEIIMGVLTHDERMKIGRRIQAARMLKEGHTYEEIMEELKIGRSTIGWVEGSLREHSLAYDLFEDREEKIEKEFRSQAYREVGGSTKVFKGRAYTGFTRKGVER